jgi:hypothetical protein
VDRFDQSKAKSKRHKGTASPFCNVASVARMERNAIRVFRGQQAAPDFATASSGLRLLCIPCVIDLGTTMPNLDPRGYWMRRLRSSWQANHYSAVRPSIQLLMSCKQVARMERSAIRGCFIMCQKLRLRCASRLRSLTQPKRFAVGIGDRGLASLKIPPSGTI